MEENTNIASLTIASLTKEDENMKLRELLDETLEILEVGVLDLKNSFDSFEKQYDASVVALIAQESIKADFINNYTAISSRSHELRRIFNMIFEKIKNK